MSKRNNGPHVERRGNRWLLRWWDKALVESDGKKEFKSKLFAKVIATYPEVRSKDEARKIGREVHAKLKSPKLPPEACLTLKQFVETAYLPHVESEHSPSTIKGYRLMWDKLKPYCGHIRLKDFRTHRCTGILTEINRKSKLGQNTLKHLKAFLSGIFRYAKSKGSYDGLNPIQDAALPRGNRPRSPEVYSVDETQRILGVFRIEMEKADGLDRINLWKSLAALSIAAMAGLRFSEVNGIRWEDYDAEAGTLTVNQKVWNGKVGSPKTEASAAPVPVIQDLADILLDYRQAMGGPEKGYIIPSLRNNQHPIRLRNLTQRTIEPILEKAGIAWKGFHAFRHSLASLLHSMGVDVKTAQAILRHSDVHTTQQIYTHIEKGRTDKAMSKLNGLFNTCSTPPAVKY